MGKTILELFKGSTQDTSVKRDTETLIEQETTGTRVRSAVELNNPLLYGNETIRIVNRTTSTVEDMKQQTGGEAADGGLIGKGLSKLTGGAVSSISQARDAVNSKLGIPSNPIPSRLIGDIGKLPSTEPITKDNVGEGLQGTQLGALLKSTSGGTPKTLAKQALGKGIGLAKDKLRGALFGQGQSIGDVIGDDNGVRLTYNDQNTYTRFNQEERNIFEEGGIVPPASDPPLPFAGQSSDRIDLRKVSPIYGIGKGRYGNSSNAYVYNPDKPRTGEKLPSYFPDNPYLGGKNKSTPLESIYGIGRKGRLINLDKVSPSDNYTLDDEQAFIKIGNDVYKDFVPVWFRKKGTEKPIAFRAVLSGITETTSPSWSSNKFVGNPYSFYMYDGVERSLAFNIKLFATGPDILNSIWERLKILTAYSYPTISQGLTTPPIIEFRLGSIYVGKTGFIENLTYTIPDESNWETNDEGIGYLPKTIDVAITVKFIEQNGSEDRLYDFTISKEAAKAINEKREATAVSGDPQTGEGEDEKPPKMTTKGDSKLSIIKKGIKSANPLAPSGISIPSDFGGGKINPKESQSGLADKNDGKTPIEASKATGGTKPEDSRNLTPMQKEVIKWEIAPKAKEYRLTTRRELPAEFNIQTTEDWSISCYVYAKNSAGTEIWVQINQYGDTHVYRILQGKDKDAARKRIDEARERAIDKALGL